VFEYDLTQEMRAEILNGHNAKRSGVSPSASNMGKLMWDDNLEIQAQVWASYCTFQHGGHWDDRTGYLSGQNLFTKTGWSATNQQAGSPSKPMNSWWNENQYYDYDANRCTGSQCGHYTQMARGEAEYIGCGRNHCQNGIYVDFMENDANNNYKPLSKFMWTWVCVYSKGNVANSKPYHEGESCSDCGSLGAHYRQGNCENNLCLPDTPCRGRRCAWGGTMNYTTCLCDCPEDKPGAYCNDVPDADKVAKFTNGNRYGMHLTNGVMPLPSELSEDLQGGNAPWPARVATPETVGSSTNYLTAWGWQ